MPEKNLPKAYRGLFWLRPFETLLSKPKQFILLAVRINLFALDKPSLLGVMVNLD
jgi:hypothetical protein